MFSQNDKCEIIEIHNFIRNNLNKSLSNEKTILKYLISNYSIKENEANLYIKIIKAEWQ